MCRPYTFNPDALNRLPPKQPRQLHMYALAAPIKPRGPQTPKALSPIRPVKSPSLLKSLVETKYVYMSTKLHQRRPQTECIESYRFKMECVGTQSGFASRCCEKCLSIRQNEGPPAQDLAAAQTTHGKNTYFSRNCYNIAALQDRIPGRAADVCGKSTNQLHIRLGKKVGTLPPIFGKKQQEGTCRLTKHTKKDLLPRNR